MIKPRFGVEVVTRLARRGGAGTHADRRTKRARTRGAQQRQAIKDQR